MVVRNSFKFSSQEYWRQCGLEADPFPLQSESIYFTPHWRQYLDFLLHTERYRRALMLVTGVAEVGKTTLLHHLSSKLSAQAVVVSLVADTAWSAKDLWIQLAEKFGLTLLAAIPDQTARITQLLQILNHTGQHYIVLIDNADQLSLEAQQFCWQIMKQQLQSAPALQIILFGLPVLTQQFAKIAQQHNHRLHDPLIHTLKMEAFTRDEVQRYIKDQLQATGYNGRVTLFTKTDYTEVYAQSKGLPGKVRLSARASMAALLSPQQGYREPTTRAASQQSVVKRPQHKAAPVLERSLWWIGALIVIAILLFWALPWLQNYMNNRTIDIAPPPADTSTMPPAISMPPMPALASSVSSPAPIASALSAAASAIVAPVAATSAPAASANTVAVPPGTRLIENGNISTISSLPATAASAASAQPVIQLPPQKDANPLQKRERDLVNQQLKEMSQVAPNEPAAPTPSWAASSAAPQSASNAAPMLMTYDELSDTEKRLLKVSHKMYTLQLFSGTDPDQVQQFVGQHNIGDLAATYRTIRNNQFTYIVILGYFSSKIEAEQAISGLDPGLQKLNPWPRSFVAVHTDIKKLL